MKRLTFLISALLWLPGLALAETPLTPGQKLAQWRQGVWIMPDGNYAIYTQNHYFVLYASSDSSAVNLYCGASQVKYTEQGMARKQVLRIRQLPNSAPTFFKENLFQSDHSEAPLLIDSTQFQPGSCNVKDGIIYDSVTEVTDEYVLLSSCNGDREKIFSHGVAVYLPVGGGEAYSYRIEEVK